MMARRLGPLGALLVAIGLGAGWAAVAASAHVTVAAPGVVTGASDAVITIRVPDESDNASTTGLKLKLPTDHPIAGVLVAPQAGWTATIKQSKHAASQATARTGVVLGAIAVLLAAVALWPLRSPSGGDPSGPSGAGPSGPQASRSCWETGTRTQTARLQRPAGCRLPHLPLPAHGRPAALGTRPQQLTQPCARLGCTASLRLRRLRLRRSMAGDLSRQPWRAETERTRLDDARSKAR